MVLTHVLRSAEGDTGDALDAGEVNLLHGLAGFLLVAGVDHSGRAGGEVAVTGLDLGVGAAVIFKLLNGGLLGLLIGEFLNTWVRHLR